MIRFNDQKDSSSGPHPAFVPEMNRTLLLSVIVGVVTNQEAPGCGEPGDTDDAIRQLYRHHAEALRGYIQRFCPDPASAPTASNTGKEGMGTPICSAPTHRNTMM